jgi:hypothetical protein
MLYLQNGNQHSFHNLGIFARKNQHLKAVQTGNFLQHIGQAGIYVVQVNSGAFSQTNLSGGVFI